MFVFETQNLVQNIMDSGLWLDLVPNILDSSINLWVKDMMSQRYKTGAKSLNVLSTSWNYSKELAVASLEALFVFQ